MKIVMDTSAWVEYFLGSAEGEIVNKHLKSDEILTPFIVLLELSCKAYREKWDAKTYLNFIKLKSRIIGIPESSILNFGKTYCEARKKREQFGLADAIILVSAISEKVKILTKDKHFSGFEEAIILKK